MVKKEEVINHNILDSKFYENIINAIADPIFVKDEKHRWIFFNSAFYSFMGHKREELIGKSDYEFFPKREADIFWKKDEEVFKSQKENINEENFTDASGVTHIIITKKNVYQGDDGRKILVGIITDVTKQKETEEKLKEKITELEKINKIMVDRELKMVELKERIKILEEK